LGDNYVSTYVGEGRGGGGASPENEKGVRHAWMSSDRMMLSFARKEKKMVQENSVHKNTCWLVAFILFACNMILMQMVAHRRMLHASIETKRPDEIDFDDVPRQAAIVNAVENERDDGLEIKFSDDFMSPGHYDDLDYSTKDKAFDIIEKWNSLWRGIASLILFEDKQTDTETSWSLVEEELNMLKNGGVVDMLLSVRRIRSGSRLREEIVKKGSNQKDRVESRVVDYLLKLMSGDSDKISESRDFRPIDMMDTMLLLKYLMENRLKRRQMEKREQYLREHGDDLTFPGSVSKDTTKPTQSFVPL